MGNNGTSILEHLTVEETEARFLLDGDEVRIRGDAFTPALRALKGLYAEARAEIEAHEAAINGKTGVLPRIRSFGKRLFRGFGSKRIFSDHTADSSQPAIFGNATSTAAQQTSAPTLATTSFSARLQPATSGIPVGNAMIEAIFADRTGVRVIWGHPSSTAGGIKEVGNPTALTFPLDSQMGRRLQACYAEFAKLGYKVVDLDALVGDARVDKSGENRGRQERAPSATKRREGQPQPDIRPPQPISATVDASQAQGKEQQRSSSPTNGKAPETSAQQAKSSPDTARPVPGDPTESETAPEYVIVRPRLSSSDNPARALASAVEKAGDPEVLNTPEWFLRALTAASDTGIEEKNRLIFLRCIRAKTGLEILDLGFGVKAGNDWEPERWEEATTWWESKGKALVELPQPVSHGSQPTEPGATPLPTRQFEPGRAPLRTGPEPTSG
jgi:hypothetical protein